MSHIVMLRVVGLFGIGLVIVLSVIPAEVQIRTGTSKGLEHAAAYFVLGLVLAKAYGAVKGSAACIAILLMGISGALELVQAWCPGRTPSVSDWLGGILGTSTAVLLHIVLKGWWGGHLEGRVRHASAVATHHLQYWWRGE
jgi:hypothetical protein